MVTLLDTGLTLAETLAEVQASRADLGPTFNFDGNGDGLALLQVFASFR